MNPNSHGQHYSKRLECLLHSPSWIEKEIIKTPAYPARLVTSSRPPLHRLRRVSITCATDLRLTLLFSYHSCFYCNRKTNFWARPLCAFWIMRTRRVENLSGWAFLFLLSLMIAGVLEFLGSFVLGCITERAGDGKGWTNWVVQMGLDWFICVFRLEDFESNWL